MVETVETGRRPTPACPKCGQPTAYVFRQQSEQEGMETRTFECPRCKTEITVHVLPDDE